MKKNRIFIALIIVWSIIPVLWALRTSLLTNQDLYVNPLIYFGTNLDSYKTLFVGEVSSRFFKALENSSISSILGTVVGLTLTAPCAYVFSKYQFKFKKIIYVFIISILAIPFYTLMIPVYRYSIAFSLVDTQLLLIILYVTGYSPVAFLIMKLYFDAIPKEIEEVGLIEGASNFRRFLISLKMILPGVVASGMVIFFNIWGSFMIPLIFSGGNTKPLTIFITEFVTKSSIDFSLMTTVGIVTLIVPITLIAFLNKYFIDGLITISK